MTPGRFVNVVADLLRRGHRVRFRASGGSMYPAICHDDLITVEPVAPTGLTPGSIVVYRRLDRLFAHRLVGVEAGQSGAPLLVLRGDAADTCDAPVAWDQVLGRVVAIDRAVRPPRGVRSMVRRALSAGASRARRLATRTPRLMDGRRAERCEAT